MGMTDDAQRLAELDRTNGQQQYGQYLQLSVQPGQAGSVRASKDLIRVSGTKYDINAWRVYLGPWQTTVDTVADSALSTVNYAQPTPWAPPRPTTFDSFVTIPLYAKIDFGVGGIQHVAYVDWPKRGLLFQVSCQYLQVNAYADTGISPILASQLPYVRATIGPEPGGGDAANPATYTYPTATGDPVPLAPTKRSRDFQIPPFARAFVPVVNLGALIDAGATLDISIQNSPGDFGDINVQQSWRTPVAGAYEQDLGRDPYPIAGQQSGSVRLVVTNAIDAFFGCMFFLDL